MTKLIDLKQGDFVIPRQHLLNLSNKLSSVCYLDKGPENHFTTVDWKPMHGAGIILETMKRDKMPFHWVKILTSRGAGWCYDTELTLFEMNK